MKKTKLLTLFALAVQLSWSVFAANTSSTIMKSTSTSFIPLGNALNFDGIDDYVRINDPFENYTNTLTIESWILFNGASNPCWMGQSSANIDNMSTNVWLWHEDSPNSFLFFVNDAGTWRSVGATATNGWHHVATVADASSIRIYIDGVLTSTATGIHSIIRNNTNSVIDIGKDPRYGANSGRITNANYDEVRIWNTARTATEIQNNMSNYLVGNEPGLVEYYRFDQGNISTHANLAINTLIDYSGNCRTGTLTNFGLTAATSNWVFPGNAEAPILTTTAASVVGGSSATLNGNVFSIGETSITTRGFKASTSSCMTTPVVFAETGTYSTGTYSLLATGLLPVTTYYYRAYATNSKGTSLGEVASFTTSTTTPTLSTTAVSSITATSATSGGNVTATGGASVNARGVCWSTSTSPLVSGSHTSDGSGTGSFTSSLTGLTVGTTNYVRAYATNSVGTSYGNEVSFTFTNANKNLTDLANPAISDVAVADGFKFTSDEAGQTVHSISVEPGAKLDLTNALSVSGDLTLKANDNSSFSATVGAGLTVNGSVKYVKTMAKDHWYFISFPCDVLKTQITNTDGSSLGTFGEGLDWDIEYYDGAARAVNHLTDASNWITIGSAIKMDAFKGYIFWLKPGAGTVDVQFILQNSLVASEGLTAIPVAQNGTGGTVHDGWNLVGQPYLSKYAGGKANVNFMTFPNPDGGLTYTSVAKTANGNAGRVVNPFTAYFVQVAAAGTISFATIGRQAAPATLATDLSDRVQLNFTSATGSDNTSLIMDNSQSSAYQIGEDMVKWLGTGTSNPQVYTVLGGTNYAFNALPMNSVVNLPVGIYTQMAGTTTISANASAAPGLSHLLLTDNSNGAVTDLLTSNYSFTATAGTTNTRFAITAQRITTDNTVENLCNEPTLIIDNLKLVINNLKGKTTVRVFDAIGRMMYNKQTVGSTLEINRIYDGMYTVQIVSGTNSCTKKIVVSNR